MDQVHTFLRKAFAGIGSSFALSLSEMIGAEQWVEAQSLKLDPRDYESAQEYMADAQALALISKLPVKGGADTRKAAIESLFASEQRNALTNARLTRYIRNQGPYEPSDELVIRFISEWRKKVSRVVGKAPLMLEPAFSGGATLSHTGRDVTLPDKMTSHQAAYPRLLKHPLLLNYLFTPLAGERLGEDAVVARANKHFTVSKNATTDRNCCKEAPLNLFLQLAVGKELKRRYRHRYKVDLTTMKPVHTGLARAGSAGWGDWCTVDLKAASDSICRVLIHLLFDDDWVEILETLRAPSMTLDGTTYRLEMFSSMGNGFTWELQTVLFRTLLETLGVPLYECFVFGDDCILPSKYYHDFQAALKFFGFTLNEKKSFSDGPFRESCGGDYFLGTAVRPYYLSIVPDDPRKWLSIANGLSALPPWLFDRLRAAWRYAVDQLPTQWRNYVPRHFGDVGLHNPPGEELVKPVLRHWYSYEYDHHATTLARAQQRRRGIPETAVRQRKICHDRIPMVKAMVPQSLSYPIERWGMQGLYAVLKGSAREVTRRGPTRGYRQVWLPIWGNPDDEYHLKL